MAKKKFLNLDNMNILWDNIDRNFLRKEDIPYVEFDALLTENNTIIGAINELYKLLQAGGGPSIPVPQIQCSTSNLTIQHGATTKTIEVTYVDYETVTTPVITYNSGGSGWLTLSNPTSGSTRTYSLTINQNSGGDRQATIKFSCKSRGGEAVHNVTVHQSAAGDATITFNPSSLTFNPDGGSKTVNVVYTDAANILTPTETLSWIEVTASGSGGNWTYTINALNNTTGSGRNGSIQFACIGNNGKTINKTFSLTQNSYGNASIDISNVPTTIDYNGGTKTFNVVYSTFNSINSATSDSNWVSITETDNNGGGTVSYSISVNKNTSTAQRTANLTFSCVDKNGSTKTAKVQLRQSAVPSASISCSPSPITINWDTESVNVDVTYSNYSEVLEPSIPNWFTIEKLYELGEDKFRYAIKNIDKNTSTSSKTGTITFKCKDLAGTVISKNITITQGAAPSGSLTVSPKNASINADGGDVIFDVAWGNSEYYWVEKANSADNWIVLSGGTSSSNGSTQPKYSVNVKPNESTSSRTANIIFKCHGYNGEDISYTVTINQSGKTVIPDSITVNPSSVTFEQAGGQKNVTITCNTNWSVANKPEWITISSANGNGNGSITLTASVNDNTVSRTGTVKLSAGSASATINISQNAKEIPTPSVSPMYYGHTPADMIAKYNLTAVNPNGFFTNITEDCIKECVEKGYMIETDAKTMGKTSIGIVPVDSLIVIAVPSSSNLEVKQDNGLGVQIEFTVTPVTNGEQKTIVNGISYDLYGQLAGVTYNNDKYFYVNNK